MGIKKILHVLLYLLFSTSCIAQSLQTENLKRVLNNAKEDTAKVNTLLALSKSSNLPVEEALLYANSAKDLATKLQFQKGRALALKGIGMVYYKQGKYLETLDYWIQSLNAFDSLGDKVGVANLLSNIGAVYSNQTEDAKALEYYFKSLKVAEELVDFFLRLE